MSEHENDGFYWEPTKDDDLRQGDLLFNVPIALMPQQPRFVLGDGETVETQTFEDYPQHAPSDLIVVEARFGVLGMVVTPSCHVSETEKDEDIVAVVPVQALNLVVNEIADARAVREGKKVPKHLFYLPPTPLGGGILRFHGVALLDRPASMLKDNLRDYRRLGLYVESRIKLRKELARFWARGDASESIEKSMRAQLENRALEDLEWLPENQVCKGRRVGSLHKRGARQRRFSWSATAGICGLHPTPSGPKRVEGSRDQAQPAGVVADDTCGSR